MPAQFTDCEHLGGLVNTLKNGRASLSDTSIKKGVIDALEYLIDILGEGGNPNSPEFWLLGALRASTKLMPNGVVVVVNRPLYEWAMADLHKMYVED